ncbi:hypothetical protein RND81_07G056000 [Saponaria officinalis]|uniref:Uncharacterized protein n=1 Tax=Saponaria officinalis TaxID=3572 RepID=A0AAW1JP55_SAPOF
MPGTIQVSILEVVGLPSRQQPSLTGITVSMGKQAYDIEEKGDFSFVLASLRDNLRVTVRDSEGNEIAHTDVESRSIVEKCMWDDIFPLQGGGHVHMRLHFILTEEEQKRICSMRESAARKKQEDLIKRSRSSSDLAVASGGSSAPRGDSLNTSHQTLDGIVNRAGGQPQKTSPGSSAKVPSQVHSVPKKQAFSTSKSTGALDKLPDYQRVKKEIQQQNEEQQSQLDKTPSSVKNMILAFESSPAKEAPPATSKTRATTAVSSITTTDIPLKAPKKTVPVSTKPVLAKLQPVLEEKVKEREEVTTDPPSKFSKKMVSVTAEPVLSNLETSPVPISKTIVTEKEEIGDNIDSCQETLCGTTVKDIPMIVPEKTVSVVTTKSVLSNLETASVTMSDETVPEVEVGVHGDYLDACPETLVQKTEQFKELGGHSTSDEKNISPLEPEYVVSREEIISTNNLHSRLGALGQSRFSWKMLSRELPRRAANKSLMKKQISKLDSSVLKKNWRSKHIKSCERNVKPKVSCGNKYYSSSSFRGWVFLEEMTHSCVRSGDRPLIDQLEGSYSNHSPDAIQEKQTDTDVVLSKNEKSSAEPRAFESGERADSRPHIKPIRQVVNIAIMVGFGILVLLTRQRK